MHDVLRQSEHLYRAAQRSADPDRWAVHVEKVFRLSIDCWADREAYFNEARRERLRLANPRDGRHLWFFSHGSLELFQRFLEDRELRAGFGQLLGSVNTRRPNGFPGWAYRTFRSSRANLGQSGLVIAKCVIFDYQVEHINDALSWFVMSGAFLPRSHGFHYFASRSDGSISLMPNPELEEESRARLTRQVQLEEAPNALRGEAVANMYPFHLLKGNISHATLEEILEEASHLIKVELDEVAWDLPEGYQPISGLYSLLKRMVANGAWPIFTTRERPILAASRVHGFMYPYPVRGLGELINRHLKQTDDSWQRHLYKVENGRLPIGLKLHSTEPIDEKGVLAKSSFRLENSGQCVIMPPVGNISVAAEVLTLVERRFGVKVLDNPSIQIQVCSPGELTPRHAALLGVCFYLGSSELRRFKRKDFITSGSTNTGARLIVYGAQGPLNRSFDWWGKNAQGELGVVATPATIMNRTDVLTCRSLQDIDTVNLVATLLTHVEHGGFWEDLGGQFIAEVEGLLDRHGLSGLLDVPWIYGKSYSDAAKGTTADPDGTRFFDMFSELMEYAFAEEDRIRCAIQSGDTDAAGQGLLFEMRELLDQYRQELIVRSPRRG
jgi:hypothetical protein